MRCDIFLTATLFAFSVLALPSTDEFIPRQNEGSAHNEPHEHGKQGNGQKSIGEKPKQGKSLPRPPAERDFETRQDCVPPGFTENAYALSFYFENSRCRGNPSLIDCGTKRPGDCNPLYETRSASFHGADTPGISAYLYTDPECKQFIGRIAGGVCFGTGGEVGPIYSYAIRFECPQ